MYKKQRFRQRRSQGRRPPCNLEGFLQPFWRRSLEFQSLKIVWQSLGRATCCSGHTMQTMQVFIFHAFMYDLRLIGRTTQCQSRAAGRATCVL